MEIKEAFQTVLQQGIDKALFKKLTGTTNDVKVTAIVHEMTPLVKVEYRVKFAGDNTYTKFNKTLQMVMKNKEPNYGLMVYREVFDMHNVTRFLRKQRRKQNAEQ